MQDLTIGFPPNLDKPYVVLPLYELDVSDSRSVHAKDHFFRDIFGDSLRIYYIVYFTYQLEGPVAQSMTKAQPRSICSRVAPIYVDQGKLHWILNHT
jgi:hypothetical protein